MRSRETTAEYLREERERESAAATRTAASLNDGNVYCYDTWYRCAEYRVLVPVPVYVLMTPWNEIHLRKKKSIRVLNSNCNVRDRNVYDI